MKTEKIIKPLNGYAVAVVLIILAVSGTLLIENKYQTAGALLIPFIAFLGAGLAAFAFLLVVFAIFIKS